MSHVVRLYEAGAPTVLRFEEQIVGAPGPGQVRLREAGIGPYRSRERHRG